MAIRDILFKREYLPGLSLIIINLIVLFSFFDFSNNKRYERLFLTNFFMIVFEYICCIFLGSEFNTHFLKIYQIQLEKVISYLLLIVIIPVDLNFCLGSYFYLEYIGYKILCPFTLDKLDYKLHFKRRCQLYNIDKENYYPFQYICSYNPEKNQIFTIFSEKDAISHYSNFKCSKVETLIKNNKVINKFINANYKEEDLYYCNLAFKPFIYPNINPKKCDSNIIIYPELLILIHFYLTGKYFQLLINYFNNIKANVNRIH